MRKTIFGRIFTFNIIVVSFCLIAMGILLFTFFTNNVLGEKRESLQDAVGHVTELTVFFQDNPNSATERIYEMTVNEIAHRVGGVVFLVNADGEVISGSANHTEHIRGTLPSPLVSRLFDGEFAELGRFSGTFSTSYFLVSEPISFHGTTPAVSCVAVPMPNINQYRNNIFRTVLLSIAVTVILTGFISYFLSRRISKPLKNISLAAKRIAKGDFSTEVPVHGNDEIAALSETFNQMTYSLKKLEDMRDGFIANVSHELRTPMTTISGFIEGILDETIPPQRQAEYLRIVLAETKRLARLVNELLLVARMEGGISLKRTSFDMNEVVRVAILRFESLFTEKNIRADISFDGEACPVVGDRDAIDRVLINLFDNALKFNRENGYVAVSVTQTEATVTVVVENSGEGIGEADLKMIWDKFYKTDRSRSKDKTGVGLGLYLVKNIIAAHGGRVHAESEPDVCTRFTFTLPKK
ncbi:MAG: HAMP domain-containing histidine kinase [Ruminococcaceae bacterium]|nr:HAMP domain-containing histidine kinase [Oscillospiraceae bacterium]